MILETQIELTHLSWETERLGLVANRTQVQYKVQHVGSGCQQVHHMVQHVGSGCQQVHHTVQHVGSGCHQVHHTVEYVGSGCQQVQHMEQHVGTEHVGHCLHKNGYIENVRRSKVKKCNSINNTLNSN